MADDRYYLCRGGWRVLKMDNCPEGFPLEQKVTFLIGKLGSKGKYRVAWVDQSGVFRYLDNLSLRNGELEVTISVGKQKWVLSGKPVSIKKGEKPKLEGSIRSAAVGKRLVDEPQTGAGTWSAEGNPGGG